MYESVLPKVLAMYGIKYQQIFDFQKGYRNEIWPVKTADGQMINVTFYKSEPGITDRIIRSNLVSEYLAIRGMPTRTRIDGRIIKLENNNFITNVCVYNYLPGSTIPWEAYTMDHIKLLGMMMSNMHALLSEMHVAKFPIVYDEYSAIIDGITTYFSKSEIQNAIHKKLNIKMNLELFKDYTELLDAYKSKTGQQVLHMDFVRGNILFDENSQISGILDFEKTTIGHTVVDIARTLAFLLVDCKYKTAEKVDKYFLYSGYQKRGQNKDIGNDFDRDKFVEMFLVYDFYKFLRHNPYESLELNEHFIRTRDILAKRGVIFYK